MAGDVAHLPAVGADAGQDLEPWKDGALSVEGAVRWTGASRSEVYRAMGAGEIIWTTKGRRRLIARRALVSWLAAGVRRG